uniref:Uncharacterized protein n=1 Tax=Anguilla anguilla TaxID=7936 RepID=A0A0E9X5U5_ANGAN
MNENWQFMFMQNSICLLSGLFFSVPSDNVKTAVRPMTKNVVVMLRIIT